MQKKFKYKNILVRMPNHLGDLIMASAVLKDIRQSFKEAKINLLCLKKFACFLKKDKNVDEILTFENISAKVLKELNFDLGILLTNSFSSAFMFYKANVNERVGYKKDFRSFLLTKKMKLQKEHQVMSYKRLLNLIGIKLSENPPKIFIDEKDIFSIKNFLKQKGLDLNKKIVSICPFAAYGPAKCWGEVNFRNLAKKILEDKNISVLFLAEDKNILNVNRMIKNLDRAFNLAGLTSIAELACIIKVSDFFISNDSGPMHIAAALNKKQIAIFGPTDEKITAPFGKENSIIKKDIFCSPCFKKKCNSFFCMKNILVDEVFEKFQRDFYV